MNIQYELSLLESRLANKREELKGIQTFFKDDIKDIQGRIRSFKSKHCSEFFVGKFWKNSQNTYYYCKKIVTVKHGNEIDAVGPINAVVQIDAFEQEEQLALVDTFKIYENNGSFVYDAQNFFYKNSLVSYDYLEMEITREEYEIQLQELTKNLLLLLDLDRKVLFEKYI